MIPKKEGYVLKDGHKIYYCTHGNLGGPAIIVFHGGPGGKSKSRHTEVFDLEKYHVILFDQRGNGKSTPQGLLEYNTTTDLLEDADSIRQELGIEKWFVSGGSWGSTLALLYAQKYRNRVLGLLLSAVWIADKPSEDWAMRTDQGVAQIMPDVWQRRMDFFQEQGVNLENYPEILLAKIENGDQNAQKMITAAILCWERNLCSPLSAITYIDSVDVTQEDIDAVRIFLHYEKNNWFTEEDEIMNNISTIKKIPTMIVHGRHDILCPMKYAFLVSQHLDNCNFVIASESGHRFSAEGEELKRLSYMHFLDSVNS